MDQSGSRLKSFLVAFVIGLFALIVFGLIWFFFIGPATPVGLGWYLFSFAAGLSMIVLPCTLPLAFVIVPLSMGKGAAKGLGIAIAFGLGVAITLSMYGVIAAVVGEVAIGTLGAPLETVKNWLYFVAGAFAFLFALGEIGLVRYRMPSYTGAAPGFIQRRGDYLKALLLGLFLGNIGVGCPHPATPVILTRIAASGDVFYGWLLFFVHAIGRILPLLLLALLGILGINALRWLVARKEKVERATGWAMVFVAGFILVLGLFSHDWWVYSGQHTLLEEITQEERFIGVIAKKIGVAPPHTHGIPTGTGLLGLPLALGNWVLVALWVLPLWWYYFKKKNAEPALAPLRRWFYLTLTLLLALTFIWVLPDRFLNHTSHRMMMEEEHPQMERMHEEGEEMHAGILHREESDVRSGLAVGLNLTPVPVRVASTTRLDFFVHERPANTPVRPEELELDHTQRMHVIGVRDDMNQFFHIHPQPTSTPGLFNVEHMFPAPGRYKTWSEIRKDEVTHTYGHPEFIVEGEGEPPQKQVDFGRNTIVGNYQISLEMAEPVPKGHEHDLAFDIHTLTGQEVEVEEYLGAPMHLAIIKDDWKHFIHTHPGEETDESMDHHGSETFKLVNFASAHGNEETPGVIPEGEGDDAIEFHVTFPEAGLYRAFAQFRPRGIDLPPDEALTASFWINVVEKKPGISATVTNRIGLTIISIVLIVLLSLLVRRYLFVRRSMSDTPRNE